MCTNCPKLEEQRDENESEEYFVLSIITFHFLKEMTIRLKMMVKSNVLMTEFVLIALL
jgi:hypothetical protein